MAKYSANFRQRGFSLIEIMVVMAIIGLVMGMVAMNLDSLVPSSRLGAAARQIASTVTLALDEAAMSGKFTIIRYDFAERSVRLLVFPEKVGDPREELMAVTFPTGIEFKDIDVAGDRTYTETYVELSISPLGSIPGHTIHLTSSEGDEMTVEVNPLSGLVSIKEGYQEAGFIQKVR